MRLKKINKYFFTLFVFFHTGLSQDYLPLSKISLNDIRGAREFFPDLIASHASQIAFIDKKNHTLGMYANDSLRIIGGYGSSEYSFLDPVDIVIDNLDIMVLDESAGRVTKYDLNLNFIQLYDLAPDYTVYPSVFDVDSRQNIYYFNRDDGVLYRRNYREQNVSKFIDYSSSSLPFQCLSDIYINQKDQIGVLFDCSNELHTYGRSGRLQRKYSFELKNALKALFVNDDWIIINSAAQVQFINGPLLNLYINQETVLDSYLDQNNLFILTKNNIYIFDLSILSK